MTTIQNQAHSCQVALGEAEGAALGKLPKSANLRLRIQKGVLGNFNHTDRKIMRNLHGMIIKNTANYSLNLPICVCSSRKFDKIMGKYAKIMKKNTKSM